MNIKDIILKELNSKYDPEILQFKLHSFNDKEIKVEPIVKISNWGTVSAIYIKNKDKFGNEYFELTIPNYITIPLSSSMTAVLAKYLFTNGKYWLKDTYNCDYNKLQSILPRNWRSKK